MAHTNLFWLKQSLSNIQQKLQNFTQLYDTQNRFTCTERTAVKLIPHCCPWHPSINWISVENATWPKWTSCDILFKCNRHQQVHVNHSHVRPYVINVFFIQLTLQDINGIMSNVYKQITINRKANTRWHTVFPDGAHEVICGVLQQRNYILVEWVHVFQQPLITAVIHSPGIVDQAETGTITEVWPLKLWMSRVLHQQLLNQRPVGCFRKPTLFINQWQDSHRLTALSTTQQVYITHLYRAKVNLIKCSALHK